jgi:hypothetical protein
MRAIILYPLNALVEDQLGRRSVPDGDNAKDWLQTRRSGNRFPTWDSRTCILPKHGSSAELAGLQCLFVLPSVSVLTA